MSNTSASNTQPPTTQSEVESQEYQHSPSPPVMPGSPHSDEGEVEERTRRPEKKITTDPRTVPFTIGRGRVNLKTKGKELKETFGETVFIKFVHPRDHDYGFWKILSRSEPAMLAAEQWLKDKEAECQAAIEDGSYVPRPRRSRPDGRRRDDRSRSHDRRHAQRDDRRYNRDDRRYRDDRGYNRDDRRYNRDDRRYNRDDRRYNRDDRRYNRDDRRRDEDPRDGSGEWQEVRRRNRSNRPRLRRPNCPGSPEVYSD